MSAFLLIFQAAALYYLGSRALITRWLWSRYPTPLATFMDCSACTGFWYGTLLAATVGYYARLSYLGLDLREPITWPIVGLCSIATTPIAAGLMQRGLDWLGVIAPEQPSE